MKGFPAGKRVARKRKPLPRATEAWMITRNTLLIYPNIDSRGQVSTALPQIRREISLRAPVAGHHQGRSLHSSWA